MEDRGLPAIVEAYNTLYLLIIINSDTRRGMNQEYT